MYQYSLNIFPVHDLFFVALLVSVYPLLDQNDWSCQCQNDQSDLVFFLQHGTFLAFKSVCRSFLWLLLFFWFCFLSFTVNSFSVFSPSFLSVRQYLKCINFHFDVSSIPYMHTTCFLRFYKNYLFICNFT